MIEIRPLSCADDFTAVGRLLEKSWKHSYRDVLPKAYLDRLAPERFTVAMRAEPEKTLVLFENGVPAGVCMLGFSRHRPGCGEVIGLYILPEKMGQGYGRRLLDAAVDAFRQEGCEAVSLWVFSQNDKAIGFYQHCGFRRTGCGQIENYAGENIKMLEMLYEDMI